MNVLLISLGGDGPNAAPPLGMLYLGAVAKQKGCSVRFYDASFTRNSTTALTEFLRGLKDFTPDVCGFTLFTINLLDSYEFSAIVKEHFPSCKILVGGPHATALPRRTMEECPNIEVLAYGEGEATFSELIDHFEGGRELASIDGIYYRRDGSISSTPPRKYIADLDSIPFPAFELLPAEYPYKQYDCFNLGDTGAPIITSRGCPFECTFCFKEIFGTHFRRRSAKNVAAEMKRLVEEYGINNIFFEDDFFATNRKWLGELFAELRSAGVKVPWRCQGRVGALRQDDYRTMKANGCYHITFGVESGNDEVLRDIKKKITVKQTLETFREARQAGLAVLGNFIFGHRKDTPETMQDTLRVARQVNPDHVSFMCLAPIPGSETYSYVPEELRYQWKRHGAYTTGGQSLPISICDVSADALKEFRDRGLIEYYGSLRYLWGNVIAPINFRKPFLKQKLRSALYSGLARAMQAVGRYRLGATLIDMARRAQRTKRSREARA